MTAHVVLSALLFPTLLAVNFGVVVPLSLSCLVVLAVVPAAAWRGKMNVPFYALIMFMSAFLAFFVGRVAGWQSVHGTPLGVVVSFIFFLLVAGAGGCFLGIFFYRHPSLDSRPDAPNQTASSPIPALDEDRN